MSFLLPLLLLLFLLRPGEQAAAAENATARERTCQLDGFDRRAGDVCRVEGGPNWTYTFAYPRQAAGIPALAAHLDEQRRTSRESDIQLLVDYARDHPHGRYFNEHSYRLDADLPELLALSGHISEYSGGAHGWDSSQPLVWDRAANRRVEFEELFSAPTSAFAEIRRLLCPVLTELMIREASRWPCPEPPYSASLASGPSGRIETLRLALGEPNGRAGGSWQAEIPVTPTLVATLRNPLRGAFHVSAALPRACNNDRCVEHRQRQ